MDPEISERLETVASRLQNNNEETALGKSKDSEDNFTDYFSCSSRLLSCSPVEAEFGDSPRDRIDDMTIDETCDWDENPTLSAQRELGTAAIALHGPEHYETLNPLTRSESPSFHSDLENLFGADENNDETGNFTPGVCGLCNLGNTCFMNSGLQCLLNTPSMFQFFSNYNKDSSSSETIVTHLANLYQKVWSGKCSKVKPLEFHKAVGLQHPQFKDYRQHDCQEFLALLLNSLHELLNTASSKSHVSDLSVEPMTPHSVCEEESGTALARNVSDHGDADSSSQMALSFGGTNRCEASSSSHSSESSIGASQIRLRPLPEDVQPFRSVPVTAATTSPFTAPQSSVSCMWEAMDSISESGDCEDMQDIPGAQADNTNLIDQSSLSKPTDCAQITGSSSEEKTQLNNSTSKGFRAFEDILKDAKTSNVNVLVTEQGTNNEIVFDSDKYPKHDNLIRRRDPLENPNLTEYHNFEGKTSRVKRIKETNKLSNRTDQELSDVFSVDDSYNNTKRLKIEGAVEKEKNVLMEYERKLNGNINEEGVVEGATAAFSSSNTNALIVDEDLEADKQWEKHLGQNQSIIVDSFQGQFKSTVICSECRHVSSTYEPFMYLSVPLPHAMEQQICVTFVPANSNPPTKFLLTLDRQDKIGKIKEQLRVLMKANVDMTLELAEVLHHHIARILDDNHFIRYLGVDDPHRSIYAFEISNELVNSYNSFDSLNNPEPLDLRPADPLAVDLFENNNAVPSVNNNDDDDDTDIDMKNSANVNSNCNNEPISDKSDDWKSCVICLEEIEKGLKKHKGCSCFLCDSCIEKSVKHYANSNSECLLVTGNIFKCPVCRLVISSKEDLLDADEDASFPTNRRRTIPRVLKIPVLFRVDAPAASTASADEGSDNIALIEHQLFGHPHLIKVRSVVSTGELYEQVSRLMPYACTEFKLLLVDGQGYHCSRCLYNERCKGCPVTGRSANGTDAMDSIVTLRSGDNIAVRFSSTPQSLLDVQPVICHPTLQALRKNDELSLYDCLDAFSESETLDEHNPWYCPTCQKNQCATKTLSVWRYPDFLIVYLKRFIFHEYTSVKLDNKVSFPLNDLTLVPPTGVQTGVTRRYNLYACVNHFGGASAGHYTAYAKHPHSGQWHLFNDESVTIQKPHEDDYKNAYVLFYQKQGVPSNSLMNFISNSNIKPNIDQLILDLDTSVERDSWQQSVTV